MGHLRGEMLVFGAPPPSQFLLPCSPCQKVTNATHSLFHVYLKKHVQNPSRLFGGGILVYPARLSAETITGCHMSVWITHGKLAMYYMKMGT